MSNKVTAKVRSPLADWPMRTTATSSAALLSSSASTSSFSDYRRRITLFGGMQRASSATTVNNFASQSQQQHRRSWWPSLSSASSSPTVVTVPHIVVIRCGESDDDSRHYLNEVTCFLYTDFSSVTADLLRRCVCVLHLLERAPSFKSEIISLFLFFKNSSFPLLLCCTPRRRMFVYCHRLVTPPFSIRRPRLISRTDFSRSFVGQKKSNEIFSFCFLVNFTLKMRQRFCSLWFFFSIWVPSFTWVHVAVVIRR